MRPRLRWTLGMALPMAAAVLISPAGAREKPRAAGQGALAVRVVSSPPRLVSGGAARVKVAVPGGVALADVAVELNGSDVTAAFWPDPEGNHQLEGVLTGLPLGESTLAARVPRLGRARPSRAKLAIVNHPITGPMFSGPRQEVFLCATVADRETALLGPIRDPETCTVDTQVGFFYRSTAATWKPFDPGAPRPVDMATTTLGGRPVDFVIRWERGTINRFIYSIAVLSPGRQELAVPDLSAWNGKLLFKLQGGVGIGHYQGAPSRREMLYEPGLALGYAIAYSTGTQTDTHYNLQLGGETAIMVKSRFVVAYAEPHYTVGVGGSGGAIQQYVYGQNHAGLLDAGVPQYSYPDMVTQTIHVGDCELLERWLDSKVMADPGSRWRTWENRRLIEGLNASAVTPNPFAPLMPYMPTPGSTECIDGWRGLSPLVLNPHFCPYILTACLTSDVDVWSARNMNLSPDGGRTPAPRREGDRQAQYAAYRSGMVFRGKIDIPLIDWRHYLEPFLDMHHAHQSFAARQRMLNYDGDASNQVIWFTDARPDGPEFDQTPMALQVIDEWMANIRAHPERGAGGNKPAAAVDSCFATDGSRIAAGNDVWAGVLDERPPGACTRLFPLYRTSRIVAGGPIEGGIFQCFREPVDAAVERGLYAPRTPTRADVARLREIFPDGVCDYTKGDAGLPPELRDHDDREPAGRE